MVVYHIISGVLGRMPAQLSKAEQVPLGCIAAVVCVYVTGYRLLALPLGELSPQVTERASQPFSNNKIDWPLFPLSALAALGHLSQRERQGVRL